MDEIQILRIPANIESDKDSLNRQQTDTLIKPTENLKDYVLTWVFLHTVRVTWKCVNMCVAENLFFFLGGGLYSNIQVIWLFLKLYTYKQSGLIALVNKWIDKV